MIGSVRVQLDSSDPAQSAWRTPLATPQSVLRCEGHDRVSTLYSVDGPVRAWPDPLDALAWLERHIQAAPAGFRWIGYLAYDLGRLFEKLPNTAADDLDLPLFVFALVNMESDAPPRANFASTNIRGRTGKSPHSSFTRDRYERAVAKVIDYIRAGDVFQVNLSQRFSMEMIAPPGAVYGRLLGANPARYGGFLDFGDHALICNSPELFLRVDRDPKTELRKVMTRPIKGTRPRGADMEEELRASTKDQAELNMIVDLERNDLGRVCQVGTVKVSEPRAIEAHPTVYHGAATIEGILREEVSLVDLLRATFPGGSVTGAPKIRAMEIIEELEPVRRGPYCGAIGYLAPGGHLQFNVAIRTMIVKNGLVQIPVGGGIVADSDTASEYEETLVKARAMFAALGLSLPG